MFCVPFLKRQKVDVKTKIYEKNKKLKYFFIYE